MAPRGRPAGFVMSQEHRNKIGSANILNRLQKHFNGEVEMSPTQVTVGLALLKKVMPDLQSVALTDADHTGPAKIEIGWIKD